MVDVPARIARHAIASASFVQRVIAVPDAANMWTAARGVPRPSSRRKAQRWQRAVLLINANHWLRDFGPRFALPVSVGFGQAVLLDTGMALSEEARLEMVMKWHIESPGCSTTEIFQTSFLFVIVAIILRALSHHIYSWVHIRTT